MSKSKKSDKHSSSSSSKKKSSSKDKDERRKSSTSGMSSSKPREKKPHNSDSESTDSDGEPKKFSIFDEPIFDVDNPVYFSMYDKVKARRSSAAQKEREAAQRRQQVMHPQVINQSFFNNYKVVLKLISIFLMFKQEALLAKFSKLKQKRAEKSKKSRTGEGSDNDLVDSDSEYETDKSKIMSVKKKHTLITR